MSTSGSRDSTLLTRELAELAAIGAQAWSAWPGYGSNLFVELGERRQKPYTVAGERRSREVGSWRLRVQMAAWIVEDDAHLVVGCEDPRPVIAERIKILHGRRVTAVKVTRPALEAIFDFDGVRLLVFPAHSGLSLTTESGASAGENVQWSVGRPQGDFLSVLPGSTWAVEAGED